MKPICCLYILLWFQFFRRFFFLTQAEVSYFWFPGKSVTFTIFGQKWNLCFFSSAVFFFFGSLRMSAWVKCELLLGKKKRKKLLGKKIHILNSKNFENCLIYIFLIFFCRYYFFSEWVAFKLFLEKKQLFFSAKKISQI